MDESFDSFHKILLGTLDYHAPLVTRKLNKNTYRKEPWITPSILRSINTQKKLYAKLIKANANARDITKYKNYKKTLDKLKRSSKCCYYHTKCIQYKNNSKKLWDLINKVIGKTSDKTNIISHITVNGIDIINEKEIANEFGKYFSTVGKTFASQIQTPKHDITYYIDKITRNPKSIYLHCTSEVEIEKLIKILPNKTSSGHDNISNILLKKLSPTLIKPLALIFNHSISQGIFPNKMK